MILLLDSMQILLDLVTKSTKSGHFDSEGDLQRDRRNDQNRRRKRRREDQLSRVQVQRDHFHWALVK